jgi:hypothetical protein
LSILEEVQASVGGYLRQIRAIGRATTASFGLVTGAALSAHRGARVRTDPPTDCTSPSCSSANIIAQTAARVTCSVAMIS